MPKTIWVYAILFVAGVVVGISANAIFVSGSFKLLKQQQLTAQQKYESDLTRLKGQFDNAQSSLAEATKSSQDATRKLGEVRANIDNLVKESVRFTNEISDGLKGDIDLVDRCITDLDRYEAGLEILQRVIKEN